MGMVLIKLKTEEAGWMSYVAAINGDDGPAADATDEQLKEREDKAKEILLADIARIASAHAKYRRKAEQAIIIDRQVEEQMAYLLGKTEITVEPAE